MPNEKKSYLFISFILMLVFLTQSFFYPNFILAEEHHYLEVAFNFYLHPNHGKLEDTMGLYLSKPPLLFWILSGLWKMFGAHNGVIHFLLMSILAGILFSSQYLYRLLFDHAEQAKVVPLILLGSFLFFSRSTVFCFDSLVVLFFVLSAIGMVWALRGHYVRGFILYGTALGLGVLTKGFIILAFSLPFFMVATVLKHHYQVRTKSWYLGFLLSLLIAVFLIFSWLIPFLHQLSERQAYVFLWRRGFGVGHTYGVAPVYFYFKTCFLLFLPWLLWPYGARSLFCVIKKYESVGFKLVFYSLLFSLVILSIIPPKALRYVLSSMVLFSLLYVYALFQNKSLFFSTRKWVGLLTFLVFIIGFITWLYPEKVMSKINYPAITYAWILFFESIIVLSGLMLIFFRKRTLQFEVMRLSCFVCVCVLSLFIFPHEVISKRFDYSSFITFLNDAKNKNIPIVYCRSYGGYQYSLTEPSLPQAKYKLAQEGAQRNTFVYYVSTARHDWPKHQHYLYRLVDPSQTSALFVDKVPAIQVVGLTLKQQKCALS